MPICLNVPGMVVTYTHLLKIGRLLLLYIYRNLLNSIPSILLEIYSRLIVVGGNSFQESYLNTIAMTETVGTFQGIPTNNMLLTAVIIYRNNYTRSDYIFTLQVIPRLHC